MSNLQKVTLQSIEPLDLEETLDSVMNELAIPSRATRYMIVTTISSMVASIGLQLGGTAILISQHCPGWAFFWNLPFLFYAFRHYLGLPKAKFRVPAAAMGDDVQKFLAETKAARDRLVERVSRFNRALLAKKSLSERLEKMDPELYAAEVSFWNRERSEIQDEIREYLGILRVASVRSRRLAAFEEDVSRLKEMEKSLAGYSDSAGYEQTADVAPYVAAAQLREKLEAEREELGLPEKSLPPIKVRPLKLLKAK